MRVRNCLSRRYIEKSDENKFLQLCRNLFLLMIELKLIKHNK